MFFKKKKVEGNEGGGALPMNGPYERWRQNRADFIGSAYEVGGEGDLFFPWDVFFFFFFFAVEKSCTLFFFNLFFAVLHDHRNIDASIYMQCSFERVKHFVLPH